MCHQEGGGKEQPPLVHTSAAELIMCPAAYCCERLEMLLYFPCPNALAAFPILFILCHKMTISHVKHYSLIPQPPFWGEHSPENRSNFQKKKKRNEKKEKKLLPHQFLFKSLGTFLQFFCWRPGFTSSSPAFNTSGQWVLAQTETWWPSFENIKSCWSFCEVNRFHSVLSCEILGQERIRR